MCCVKLLVSFFLCQTYSARNERIDTSAAQASCAANCTAKLRSWLHRRRSPPQAARVSERSTASYRTSNLRLADKRTTSTVRVTGIYASLLTRYRRTFHEPPLMPVAKLRTYRSSLVRTVALLLHPVSRVSRRLLVRRLLSIATPVPRIRAASAVTTVL